MKKFLSILLAVILAVTLFGCSSKSDSINNQTNTNQKSIIDLSKTIIVYFSYTGNTEKVAEYIAEYTGLDLIKLEPSETYPQDYDACVERAETEHADNARPGIKTDLNVLKDYENIILGWPCWNYSCPMIILTMLEQYNFSNKTIIPFTTHGGSGFSKSLDEMKAVCPDAKYLEGISIYEKDVDSSKNDIEAWLSNYGMKSEMQNTSNEIRTAKDDAVMQSDNRAMPTRVIENGTKINMHFGDTVIPGILNDSETAKALIDMLPYTVHVNRYSHDFCGVMDDALPYKDEQVHYGWLNGDIDFAIDANYFTILFEDEDVSEQYGYQVNIGVIDCPIENISSLNGSYDVLIELAE